MILISLISKLHIINIGLVIFNMNIYIFIYFDGTLIVYLIMGTILYKVFRLGILKWILHLRLQGMLSIYQVTKAGSMVLWWGLLTVISRY